MKQVLMEMIISLRCMQFYYHQAHQVAARSTFFSDHDAFGSFYAELEADFDSVSERNIGMFGGDAQNFPVILEGVSAKLKSYPHIAKDNNAYFEAGLKMEEALNKAVDAACKSPECNEGLKQLLGNIADKSQVRMYKIKRRILK